MEENNKPAEQNPCEKHQESKKYLVFYVIGLFCVALALILLSYVSQVRADKRLSELSTQLDTQTSAVQGANARVEVLQQSVEEQTKLLNEQQAILDKLMKQTNTDNTDDMLAALEKLSDQKKVLYEMLLAQQELEQSRVADAKTRVDKLVTDYGLEKLNGTDTNALLKEESAALFTSLYAQTRTVQ